MTPWQVAFDAPPDVREALAGMGRTEDVRLSPSGRRLALACFARESIALVDVAIAVSPAGHRISVTGFDEFTSPSLRQPHGVDFVGDDTLVVANRASEVALIRLANTGANEVPRTTKADGEGQPDGPGSVTARPLDGGRHEVLACNNYAHTVTRHELAADGILEGSEVVVERWLDVPDGLALSADRRWLAVSNHNAHCVFVYAYPTADRDADPVAILRGARYPHGVRFGADDGYLVVADAGAPLVHIFRPSDGGWKGVCHPVASLTVMDDDTFVRCRTNSREGGPKGIDVDPRTNLLVVTAENLPLAFFDLTRALDGTGATNGHAALLRSELAMLEETLALAAESRELRISAALANAQLQALQSSVSWRVTAPVRRALDTARRLRRS